MAVGTFEVFSIFVTAAALVVVLILFYLSYRYYTYIKGTTIVRGISLANKEQGTLTCPLGKVISIQKASYICGDKGANGGGPAPECDPMMYDGSGSFNPATTFDDTATLESQCNGQSSCSVTAAAPPTMGSCTSCGSSYLVGVYNCQAQ